jgi:hypothetical protein
MIEAVNRAAMLRLQQHKERRFTTAESGKTAICKSPLLER